MTIYSPSLPYTYLLEWDSGVKYYGVRYSKNCNPEDLWVTYFTSSRYVKDYCKEYGNPSKISIRRTFSGPDGPARARNWEHRVLKKLKVVLRKEFLNRTDNKAFDNTDPMLEMKRKEKVVIALQNPDTKRLLSIKTAESWRDPKIREQRIKSQLKPEVIKKKQLVNSKRTGLNASNVDKTIYHFIHDSGIEEHCLKSELIKKYQLSGGNIHALISGKTNRTKHKGWRVIL